MLDEVGLEGPPADPFVIAREKGIAVEVTAGFPPAGYGALYLHAGAFGIVISTACRGEGHRNFTLAHELGHYHVPGYLDSLIVEGEGQRASLGGHFRGRKDPQEREADWFASELLMPGRWARRRARSSPATLATVHDLAGDFRTSRCCAAVRYAELTDTAAAVILSRDGQIEWLSCSTRMAEHGWARKAMRKEWVPRGTVTHRLPAAADRVAAGDQDAGVCLLCEWFDGAPELVVAQEDAIGLGSYGRVLTLLSTERLPTAEELEEERQEENWRETDWRDAMRGYRLG